MDTELSAPRAPAAKRLVEALAARDYNGIFEAFATGVRFRFLVPPGPGEVVGAAEAAAKYFQWFGGRDRIEIEDVNVRPVADRISLRYRFRVHDKEGRKVIEQQTYLDVDDDARITGIDLVCSGFHLVDAAAVAPDTHHRFDAGELGCADGLAQEFRRQVQAIPVGDVLVVDTSDPAAKEDLPPLARMMGHTVHSIEPSDDGRLLITVERGR